MICLILKIYLLTQAFFETIASLNKEKIKLRRNIHFNKSKNGD